MVELRRLSFRDGGFVSVVDGDQQKVADTLDVVVVNAADVSRLYYKGAYDTTRTTLPTCWSATTQTPDKEVPAGDRQSARCMDCEKNIRGSGGRLNSRACRFVQRLAVVLDGQLDTVYQLQLSSTSIFGRGKNNNKPLHEYAKFLQGRGTKIISVVTRIYADNFSDFPRLCFKPVRSLTPSELSGVSELKINPVTLQAIDPSRAINTSPFSVEDGFDYKKL